MNPKPFIYGALTPFAAALLIPSIPARLRLVGALVLIVVAVTAFAATSTNRSRQTHDPHTGPEATPADPQTTLDAALHALDQIADDYGALRCDPVAAIDHIALWDVTNDATRRFTLAYTKCTDQRRHLTTPGATPTLAEATAFADDVRAARHDFDAARGMAARQGINALPEPDQPAARRAQAAIARATDPAAPAPEAATAAAKATTLLQGITVLDWPAPAHQALDTITRKALPPAT